LFFLNGLVTILCGNLTIGENNARFSEKINRRL